MKKITLLLLLVPVVLSAQNYDYIDKTVLEYPRFSKVENLAEKISNDFKTDEEKARAAFFWLAKNIRYNLKEYYSPRQRSYNFSYATEEEKQRKLQVQKDRLIVATFLNKTGVCEEYAQSFKKICDLLNIESEVIKGNVRNNSNEIGRVAKNSNHAWNAVKISNRWLILDATWAAGYAMNGRWVRKFNPYYYDIPTNKIFKTHFPEELIWVLRFGRMTKKEFFYQPIYNQNFLGRDIEVIAPKNGIIKVKSSSKIVLRMKNLLPNTTILYVFGDNQVGKRPVISYQNKIAELTFENPQKNTEFIIFMDNSLALQYKIIVE